MSVTQLKVLSWLASLALGGYLLWTGFTFYQEQPALQEAISEEEQLKVLNSVEAPEPPRDDVVDYARVQTTFHALNWTGEAPPPPPKPEEEDKPKEVPKKPVSELLKVLLVQVDTDAPASSMAYVSYTDPSLIQGATFQDDYILREGDKLGVPWEAIEVASIQADGVHFRFTDDPEREEEIVNPQDYAGEKGYIVRVGPDGVIEPARRPNIQRASPSGPIIIPAESMLIGKDHWLIGLDDRQLMADNYPKILAEIGYKKHRDPKTGDVDGIELTDVPKGSFAAKYGAKEGQIIKSINGHPVTSVNEAISYAKQNKDKYDTWVIVYEEQGKEYTKTIDTSE